MFTVTEITPQLEAVTHDPFIDSLSERTIPLDRPVRTLAELSTRLATAARLG
jgi:hypothetical protein